MMERFVIIEFIHAIRLPGGTMYATNAKASDGFVLSYPPNKPFHVRVSKLNKLDAGSGPVEFMEHRDVPFSNVKYEGIEEVPDKETLHRVDKTKADMRAPVQPRF